MVVCNSKSFFIGILNGTQVNKQKQILAIRSFARIASTDKGLAELYSIWNDETKATSYKLSESDLIAISYELAIHYPEQAEQIVTKQLGRITNPDRVKEYKYVYPAALPDIVCRDSVYQSLLNVSNRKIEPWTVTALGLLNHPTRELQSLKHICSGLNLLKEIQQTGDIFFPKNWCYALLKGHSSKEALKIVEHFF